MAIKSNSKKKRKPKRSAGIHGATKIHLDDVQKVLLGKGMFTTMKPLGREK